MGSSLEFIGRKLRKRRASAPVVRVVRGGQGISRVKVELVPRSQGSAGTVGA